MEHQESRPDLTVEIATAAVRYTVIADHVENGPAKTKYYEASDADQRAWGAVEMVLRQKCRDMLNSLRPEQRHKILTDCRKIGQVNKPRPDRDPVAERGRT